MDAGRAVASHPPNRGDLAMSDPARERVTIYTDGACMGNPGPGGYAAVLVDQDGRREISGGRALTTSNRMEIMAAIVALESLAWPSEVVLHSDSTYLVDSVMKGHVHRWRANGWKNGRKDYANPDLWRRLIALCERHAVEFRWIRGHGGAPENDRCDRLAVESSRGPSLPADEGYERQLARASAQPTLFD